MAENLRIGSAPTTSFNASLGNTAYGAPAKLTRASTRPGSARCGVVVNRGVTPASKHSQSLGRISPMEHRVKAMLFVLLDLGQTVRPQFGEDVYFPPRRQRP